MKRDSTAYGAVRPAYDKRDCSVRALAVVSGCTYEQASAIFSAAGRQLKQGTPLVISHKVYVDWLHMLPLQVANWPMAAFIAAYPQGRFVVHRRGHACAIVHGTLHDWEKGTKASSPIISAWQVTEKTLQKIERIKGLF